VPGTSSTFATNTASRRFDVRKVEHAKRALDAGCDLVVAQGTEAGGHTGTVATLPLVPLIVDAMAGAIPLSPPGDLRRSRARGGVVVGRGRGVDRDSIHRDPEARAIPGYRETMLETREDGTVVSRAFSGKTMRVLRNDTTDRYEADSVAAEEIPDQLASRSTTGPSTWAATRTRSHRSATRGLPRRTGRGGNHVYRPAGAIVRSIVDEAQRVIDGLAAL